MTQSAIVKSWAKPWAAGPMLMAGVLLIAGAAVAAGLTGAEAAKDRQTHMKAQGGALKTIIDQLKSGAPDMAVIKAKAALIDESAKALPSWFPVGSGISADPKSAPLPAVWTDPTGFEAKANAFKLAAAKFDADAQAGDAQAVPGDVRAVGGACKSCHDDYKAKDTD